MSLCGISELFTLATLNPLINSLSSDDSNQWIIKFLSNRQFDSEHILIINFAIFSLAIIFSTFMRLFTIRSNCNFAANIGSEISSKSFFNILNRDYERHLSTNTSTTISNLTANVARTVSALNCYLLIITNGFISSFLLLSLFLVNWKISSFTIIVISSIYIAILFLIKKEIDIKGENIKILTEKLIKNIQESLGSIREIILRNNSQQYLKKYSFYDMQLRQTQADIEVQINIPRYLIENLGILTICFSALIVSLYSTSNTNFIAIFGVLLLAFQRLIPALNQIYSNLVKLKSFLPSVKEIIKIIATSNQTLSSKNKIIDKNSNLRINNITAKGVFFKYFDSKNWILKNINLSICEGDCIGIMGETGSGKSTFIDILIGLLKPSSGEIQINQNLLNNELKTSSISYVPQTIFLKDGTIRGNIAFDYESDDINSRNLIRSSKEAEIYNFIKELPNGFDTIVGENGVKLSGGQRQRIGIARSLYSESDVLIFDESTSSLDIKTEKKIINNIVNSKRYKIIIMIAHRLNTLKNCNKIIEINKGEIKKIFSNKEFLFEYFTS